MCVTTWGQEEMGRAAYGWVMLGVWFRRVGSHGTFHNQHIMGHTVPNKTKPPKLFSLRPLSGRNAAKQRRSCSRSCLHRLRRIKVSFCSNLYKSLLQIPFSFNPQSSKPPRNLDSRHSKINNLSKKNLVRKPNPNKFPSSPSKSRFHFSSFLPL